MITRAFFFALLASLSPLAQADSGNFCAQTFNVYATAYASGVSDRLERLASELTRTPCDAIQFQEFWRLNDYTDFRNNLRSARMETVQADTLRNDGKKIGLASAFSGRITKAVSRRFMVNNEGGLLDGARSVLGVEKGYSMIEARLNNSIPVLFLNLHTHPTEEINRVAQVSQLALAYLRDYGNSQLPVILTGDLNSTPADLEVKIFQDLLLFRDSYLEANGSYGKKCTYCADNPLSWKSDDSVIDFVLLKNSPSVKLSALSSQINLQGEEGDPLSDHYGVRSQVQWTQTNASLLDAKDPLVQARVKRAITTLKKAYEAIRPETGKNNFRQIAIGLRALRLKLQEDKELNFPLGLVLRTP